MSCASISLASHNIVVNGYKGNQDFIGVKYKNRYARLRPNKDFISIIILLFGQKSL